MVQKKEGWTITTYEAKRENNMEDLYWLTLCAYMETTKERASRGQKGKRGLLVDISKLLFTKYGWKKEEESYTIRRYLDRAEKLWHISTH